MIGPARPSDCRCRVATSSEDHRAARDALLNTLPFDEQARVIRHAEKVGPLPTDPDWLVAYAAERSATRMEAAVASLATQVETIKKKRVREAGRRIIADHALSRELFAFALSLGTFAGVAWFVDHAAPRVQSIVVYSAAIALGVAASALYVWLSRKFSGT